MSKFVKSALIVLALMLVVVLPASAQTPSATPNQGQVRKQEALAQREERSEERELRLLESRMLQIRAFFARANNRMQAAIARLENLITRIEARIAKINETDPDLDTTQIEADLEEASLLLTETMGMFDDLVTGLPEWFDELVESEDPRAMFVAKKAEYSEIKMNLIEVHTMLTHIIGDVKGLRLGNTEAE